MVYRVGIITASDKGHSQGSREDLSGPAIEEILTQFQCVQNSESISILPDEKNDALQT